MKKFLGVLLAAGFCCSGAWAAVGDKDNANGNYFGIGGGTVLPVQNVLTGDHGVLSLIGGWSLNPNLVTEGELDGMAYGAGYNGVYMDLRLFESLKLMPSTPPIQPYLLLGFGFGFQLGIDANLPNLASFDFVGGGGFRFELAKRFYLFADCKLQMLVRDAPTAIDAPLTGGLLFPL